MYFYGFGVLLLIDCKLSLLLCGVMRKLYVEFVSFSVSGNGLLWVWSSVYVVWSICESFLLCCVNYFFSDYLFVWL